MGTTRSATETWIIGPTTMNWPGTSCPHNGKFFQSSFFRMDSWRPFVKSSTMVAEEAMVFWDKARIPTQSKKLASKKLEKTFFFSIGRNSEKRKKIKQHEAFCRFGWSPGDIHEWPRPSPRHRLCRCTEPDQDLRGSSYPTGVKEARRDVRTPWAVWTQHLSRGRLERLKTTSDLETS